VAHIDYESERRNSGCVLVISKPLAKEYTFMEIYYE
jgi:hypothetical protein